jgi:putative nucleotidyltransferase with HDIG domain
MLNPAQACQRLKELPALSSSCHDLEALMEDPKATPSDLARVIERDAGLTTRVFRLANSPFCGIPGGVDNLPRAITILGFSTIHQIVICMQSYRILEESGASIPNWLHRHCLVTAIVAENLAARVGMLFPPRAYAAGLLHDLGRLASAVLFPEETARYRRALESGEPHGLATERQYLGIDHEALGLSLARHWSYPDLLACCVSAHHGDQPPQAPAWEMSHLALADLVAVADAWAWSLGAPGMLACRAMPVDPLRCQQTGLEPEPSPEDRVELIAEIERRGQT